MRRATPTDTGATFILQRCSVGHDALRRCTQHVLLRNALLDSLLTMRSHQGPHVQRIVGRVLIVQEIVRMPHEVEHEEEYEGEEEKS